MNHLRYYSILIFIAKATPETNTTTSITKTLVRLDLASGLTTIHGSKVAITITGMLSNFAVFARLREFLQRLLSPTTTQTKRTNQAMIDDVLPLSAGALAGGAS